MEKVFWDISNSYGATVSTDGLTTTFPGVASNKIIATKGVSTGKWYWEIEFTDSSAFLVGIISKVAGLKTNAYIFTDTTLRGYYPYTAVKYPEVTNYGIMDKINTNVIIGMFLDLDNGVLEFFRDGQSMGVSHTNLLSIGKEVFPLITVGNAGTITAKANFGNSDFYFIPSNLPEGTKGLNGEVVFNVKERFLLKSNNKIYSLKSEEILHETKMTSNTAPVPFVASASSVYSTAYPAWKAFNGVTNDGYNCWVSANGTSSGWIQIDYGTPLLVNKVTITSRYDLTTHTYATASPKDFEILVSNDNINFEKLAEFKDVVNWGSAESKVFVFPNNNEYRYYRLNILSNIGINLTDSSKYICLGSVAYSYVELLSELKIANQNNFIKYGSSSINYFNSILANKNYILQDTVSENTDGLWVQEIDRKPLSIKFEQ